MLRLQSRWMVTEVRARRQDLAAVVRKVIE
jgi:hypothetical protein